jgi:hypothetical protein
VLVFVLERELKLGAIRDRPVLVQVNVLLDDQVLGASVTG